MLGYHVFYRVSGAKKRYTTTEFFSFEKDAKERCLELAVASNIDLITLRTIDLHSLHFEVIKGEINEN